MKRTPLIIIGVLVAVILFLVLCTFVQRPYEEVIVDRAGKLVTPVTLYRGWKLCLPTDRITRIDTRNHLYTSTVKEALTKDLQTLTLRTYVAWKISDSKSFYLTLQDDFNAQTRVASLVDAKVNELVGQYEASKFFNTDATEILTESIEKDIATRVNADLKAVGLEIHQVGFSRISFPPAVAESVNQNTAKERQTAAGIYRNEGIKEAGIKRNEADVQYTNTVEEAKKTAQILRGQADRDAISILGAVTDNPYAQEWFQIYKASELAKSSFARGNNIIMLSPDSLIVKTFFANEGVPKRPVGIPAPPKERPIPILESATQPAASGPATKPDTAKTQP